MSDADSGLTPQQFEQAVSTAVLAPSVHNTQPWLFTQRADGLDVRADRSRQLTHQDPLGRELLISCGAAARQAALGVRGLGLACQVQWLPDPGDADLVARLRVGPGLPAVQDELRLLAATRLRHTDRSAFAADPVPDGAVAWLRAAVEAEGAWLADEQPDHDFGLEVLVSRADRTLRADDGVQQDLSTWTRAESVPAEGVPADALTGHGTDRGSALTLRDFDPAPAGAMSADAGGTAGAAGGPGEPPVAEHPLLLLVGTDGDAPSDWARAGAAFAMLLLTATAEGLVANPQTQVLEVPGLRARLQSELGLTGYPQMLLRVGWPIGPGSPRTGRRPTQEVVVDQRA